MFYIGKKNPVKTQEEQLPGLHTAPDWPARLASLAAQTRNPILKAFYEAGTVAADTPISKVPLLAMDFETTGIDSTRDEIVSIGLVAMSLERIRMGESHHWILKPRADLRDESVVIHGITHSEVESAPDLKSIRQQLLELMAGRVIVVHHRGIERQFLDAAFKRRTGEGIAFPCIDTMELEARLHRRKRPSLLERLMGHKRVSIRLPESRERYHLPHYPAHNALTDALACAELLQAQIAHRFSPQTPIAKLWS
ncbi:DNA polymerase III epsilon subunit [Marinobacterium lacunae]|uniref:DNA polymerase III epsilon subunit n=1 Tax=Marinobacterium lacunae TaxID=1232683 RepID=A0A081FYV8_9GAMM|nr:3'-5' exonuclease [Marinobacterium lacunae]KEA63713.1 DNA polymerase III epsilon subunit [Marinobacterium lacunae]